MTARRIPVLWTHCPNCDCLLGKKIEVGDEWHCEACGEGGIRQPNPKFDTASLIHWDTDPNAENPAINDDSDLPF